MYMACMDISCCCPRHAGCQALARYSNNFHLDEKYGERLISLFTFNAFLATLADCRTNALKVLRDSLVS